MTEKKSTVKVLEAIIYYVLEEGRKKKFSSDHFYIHRAIYKLTQEVPKLREFFSFRVPRSYSNELDNALFFITLGQLLEQSSNPALRYYEVDENKIKQIRDDIEDLPKELLESIKQGIEKIKETDEYRALVTV